MHFLTASLGSASGLAFMSHHFTGDIAAPSPYSSPVSVPAIPPLNFPNLCRSCSIKKSPVYVPKVSRTEGINGVTTAGADEESTEDIRLSRVSADWKAARAYQEKGLIYEGMVGGFNAGGLLIRFFSLVGFLPYPLLSPSHSYEARNKKIQEIARALLGSIISIQIIEVDEENRRLIFSEKNALWSKFSPQINVGDVFKGRVRSVEDYGAFVDICFPDGCYHLTGLVHVSEVSWDLIQDVRDILSVGDEVRVKIINLDREMLRLKLSIRQLEEDPLLETLEKVIPQNGSVDLDALSKSSGYDIEPLPGLETIIDELLQEDGIRDIRITGQGFEKRVVSQDLQLWLSNAPAVGEQFILLARAGRQVQEILLTTSLDQEGIKKALQRVLERVP